MASTEKKGYSSVSEDVLCPGCEHGMVMEGRGGQTAIFCQANGEGGVGYPLSFPVTVCTHFERKKASRMWDTEGVMSLDIQDGHLVKRVWENGEYFWVRVVNDDGTLVKKEK